MKKLFGVPIDVVAGRFTTTWGGQYGGAAVSSNQDVCLIEAQVHELAHCAVFGDIDALHGEGDIGEEISYRFEQYPYVGSRRGDMSEMNALAVELRVFEKMKLRIRGRLLVRTAAQSAKTLLVGEAWNIVRELQRKPITDARADTVLEWMREVATTPM